MTQGRGSGQLKGMENRESDRSQFDERSALENLERFREDIARYRAKRQAVSEQCEEFVRSFKTPQQSQGIEPVHDEARPQVIEVPASPSAPRVSNTPPPHSDGVDVVLRAASARPAQPRARSRTPALIGAALILVAAGGYVTWMVRTRAPEPSAVTPLPDTRAAAPRPAQRATVPVGQPASRRTELTTSRPVWVRVVADGQRVVERELPANARVPLTAEKTLVIRTGNAGAVRLVLAGQDQGVLGPEGAVVTRTFTVPRSTPR